MSTDQLTDMLKDTITTDISTADVIEMKKGGKTITAVGTEVLNGASYDLASVKPNDAITDGKTVVFDSQTGIPVVIFMNQAGSHIVIMSCARCMTLRMCT